MAMDGTPRKSPELDEDDDLALPARDGATDEAEVAVEDEVGIEVGASTSDEEECIGLDVREGIDEPIETELSVSDADEATRWTVGSEEARDVDAEPELPEGAEYGWTDANEPAQDIELESDLDAGPEEANVLDDRGEEGPDEAVEAALDAAGEPLPPLDADADEPSDDEPFALDVLREVSGGIADEPEHAPKG